MTSLSFGTSGLRGLVVDLVGEPTARWTTAFLAYLETGAGSAEHVLLVGRDLRDSSPQIAADCLLAAQAGGWRAVDCGALPTPALALAAAAHGVAAIMVTGSHIPEDRNGLKFYAPGEITKVDEASIRAMCEAHMAVPNCLGSAAVEDAGAEILSAYRERYLGAFSPDTLSGLTIGIYQQSSVARDILVDILSQLGAEAVALGRSERFVPIDTEAHRPEDLELLREWAGQRRFAAIVSTDGDADRPLVADSAGNVLQGDILGLLAAAHLGSDTIVTPVTSSGAVEASGIARKVVRTRVGSPFVIEGMEAEIATGSRVLGFEANGGVLLGTVAQLASGAIAPLLTRDAVLPILCTLAEAKARGLSVRDLANTLGAGHVLADRLKEVPASASTPFLTRLATDQAYADQILAHAGPIAERDVLDGVRFRFEDGTIVHFRASGNAPELRVYVEAKDRSQAEKLLRWGLGTAATQMEIV